MRARSSVIVVTLTIILSACSNTRFLTNDQVLYTGRTKIEIINSHKVKKTSAIKNQVSSITSHKVNNELFGRRVLPPIGLWVHNYWKVDNSKKIRSWVYKTLSSTPVLLSDVNPELRSKKIENELFDLGYFRTKAWSHIDTNKNNPRKARVSYFVDLTPPFHYNKIVYDTISDHLDTLISKNSFREQIKPGDQFNLAVLKTSRDTLSRRIQNNGYFYFIPEFIELQVDTLNESGKLDLLIDKKKELPQSILSVYKINKVIINNFQGSDTALTKADTAWYNGIGIVSSGKILNHQVILNSVFFRKGDNYSYNVYQRTINQLNNLGVFKSVNVSVRQNGSDSLACLLDVFVDLVMSDNISLDFETNLITKSSGYFGPLFSISVSHGNTFKGAERLKLGVNGGFEWQWGTESASQLGTYSYEFGISSGLTVPGIIIPFVQKTRSSMITQRTSINADLNLLNRVAYYNMVSVKTNLNYQWSKNKNIQHSLYPAYLNSVNLLKTTLAFDSVVNENIYIRKSFEEQFILGSKYEFTYNNTLTIRPNNFLFTGGLSTAGNLIDLLTGLGKSRSERPYLFLNNIYSQYVKLTTDFRYYRNGFNKSLAFRIYAGLGIPYGNSTALPYIEQFFSGGAYSVRGFTARYLGPGSFHTTDQSGYIDQSGDLKLESNLEYRFNMSKILKGAIFLETGNIWLVNEDPNRPGAVFHLNTFYDQLAVGTGFGLRFDFTFFVLRADVGFPIRTPYVENNRNWLFGTNKIFSGGQFYLAIGYPF
jgi:outer membrane protein assembly factor BamA